MNLQQAKQTVSIIKDLIDSNYFWDLEAIETQKRNRDRAGENGQDVSKYTDSFIRKVVLSNSLRRSFYSTAVKLYEAIEGKNKSYLKEHVRYDQKLTRKLFELYTGLNCPKTNKEIIIFIDSNF